MKVCQTCQHWSTRLKGYCHRLNQGVGRFWICEEWIGVETNHPPRPEAEGKTAPGAPLE